MKIKITTIREIEDKDYGNYIHALNDNNIPVDGRRLLDTGRVFFENESNDTKVITMYEIVK